MKEFLFNHFFNVLRKLLRLFVRNKRTEILLRRVFDRSEWLYCSPRLSLDGYKCSSVSVNSHITEEDIQICQRLITAYQKSNGYMESSEAYSEEWSDNIQAHYGLLSSALKQGDAQHLAKTLSSMFHQSFLWGIASSHLYKTHWPWIRYNMLEDLMALADCLGVVSAEPDDKGVVRYPDDLDSVVAKIKSAIGIDIGFPPVGSPYGIKSGDVLITPESPEHIYVALRVDDVIKRHLNSSPSFRPRIMEIGAGYGGLAFWLLTIRKLNVDSYFIIDLPIVNVLQGYFLSKVFGAGCVSFNQEKCSEKTTFQVLPTYAVRQCQDIDILVNENSMPEMPEHAVKEYLLYAKDNVRGIFYSYNQELNSQLNNIPQVLVPKVVSEVGGFDRISRNCSWVRHGYVEEIYVRQ